MPAFYLGKPPRVAIPKIEPVYTTISAVLLKQISPTNEPDKIQPEQWTARSGEPRMPAATRGWIRRVKCELLKFIVSRFHE
jgi:hypothetical protein